MTAKASERVVTQGVSEVGGAKVVPVDVEVIEGPDVGKFVPFSSGTLRVGSDESNELVLSDPTVSGHHVLCQLLPGTVSVRDLGSRNGIRYLGAKVIEAIVPIGGTVKLGKTTIRFSANATAAPRSNKEELCGLLGKSVLMRELFAALERVGPSDVSALITGETGVGKDAVARALHQLSNRRAAPFVVFDCAAVSPGVVESELFGHAKGAFTGAVRAHTGMLEQAGEGTLFLDEVGELPLELQPVLLRALEAREFRPVGASEVRRLRARVLAATHKNLEEEIQAGRFRADLYFRLAVTVIKVPPLRDRREDIPLLAHAFAKALCGWDLQLEGPTIAALQCDPWPGNVRELKNAVERVVALREPVGSRRPAAADEQPQTFREIREKMLEQFERNYLEKLLSRYDNNLSAVAREAGISRVQIYRLLKRHGLRA